MSYAVVRMQKMKAHDLKGIQFHNQRERESRTNLDIDKERSHENYDLVHDEKIDYNQHHCTYGRENTPYACWHSIAKNCFGCKISFPSICKSLALIWSEGKKVLLVSIWKRGNSKGRRLQEKKNELLALNEKVPDEIKVRAKREFQQIEVKSEEKNLFGIPKKELKKTPTGNVIVPEQDFKNLVHAAKENKRLKGNMEKILSTDLAKENKKLGQQLRAVYKEWETEASANKKLRQENMQLLRENSTLKSRISDLRREIGLIYKSTKEFLKARTSDFKTFKSLFNDLVGKVKERAPEGEFERLNRIEKRRERENGLER
ncbi:plasmid recombination protein [Pullulanibacillus camelliae]|uniref:plasmid recombination protein n=1 Tax=Pullulanibacillus camelliae TaxID=1707096 RepID=UPI0040331132